MEKEYKDIAAIPISVLTNLLTCSICRDLMNGTHVGITCMHRFCGTCIERYITGTPANDRSCPFCRCKIASRRQFKPEKFCAELIEIMFTNAPITQKQQFKISEFSELHKTRSAQIFEHSKTVSKNYVYVPPDPVAPPPSRAKRQKVAIIEADDDMVNLGLRFCTVQNSRDSVPARPQHALVTEYLLARPYLSAPPETTVFDLKMYIQGQIPKAPFAPHEVIIWIRYEDKIFELENTLTIHRICLDYWDRQSKFILDYSISS